MTTLIIILIVIYSISFSFTLIDIVEGSRYSKLAKKLGRTDYIIKGFFVALLPIINTIGAISWITNRWYKRMEPKEYHTQFDQFGDNSY